MINGIINLKKDAGMTSHDAVFKLRKILKEKKIGHGGTLDPDVVGVLPIAVGKATRILEFMTESGKVYEGEVTLGYATTTEDASGEIIDKKLVSPNALNETDVDKVMLNFLGVNQQIPPMYSSVKVNGRKLYDYARAGETVERPIRKVTITEFIRTSPLVFKDNCCRFTFRVACSKGTYVRTLSVDLGKELGYPSHMSQLSRTASSGLYLKDAYSLSEIEQMIVKGDKSFLLPIEYGVKELPKIELSEHDYQEISFGRRIAYEGSEETVAAFFNHQLVAILEKKEVDYKPRKVLKIKEK